MKAVEDAATSYMPTNIDLQTWLPDGGRQAQKQVDDKTVVSPDSASNDRRHHREKAALKPSAKAVGDATRRKRISLYLDDDVLTKIFRVSLEQHEQLSAATHRLILEALAARGL